MGIASRSPGVEKIRNHFAFLTPENYVNQPLVVFGMSDRGFDGLALKIKVTETNLQAEKEKNLPILDTFAVLVYHGAPFVCDLRQVCWSGFQPDQVVQYCRNELLLIRGAVDCWKDHLG